MEAAAVPQLNWFEALWVTLDAGIYLGLVSCILLALVAGLLVYVGQQLRAMKMDLRKAPLLAEDLARQLMQAREAMGQLQKAAQTAGPQLGKVLQDVERARQDLQFMTARAETVVRQMEAGSSTGSVRVTLEGETVEPHTTAPVVDKAAPLAAAVAAYRAPRVEIPSEIVNANDQAAGSMVVRLGDPLPTDPLDALLDNLQGEAETVRRGPGARSGGTAKAGRTVSQAELDLREKLGR